jgi:Amt family ammonium transporter
MGRRWMWSVPVLAGLAWLGMGGVAGAAEAEAAVPDSFVVNNLWMMVATFLVFIMHLGFAAVEAGLTRAKNCVNILFKNTIVPALGILTFAAVGFGLMYPGDSWLAGRWLGFAGFGLSLPANGLTDGYNPGYTYWTDFLFQGMFAATAATIVSGAVAERIKLGSFLIFTAIYVAVVYPLVGSWTWGGGWLGARNFHDFAGSTLVHSVGGWGALAGVIVLGPRLGRYVNGQVKPVMGHSLPLATIGVFLLWLGWFGFNGGSVLSADPGKVSLVLVTTNLAACAAMVTAMSTSWIIQKRPDHTMLLNGCLAGLVSTDPAYTVGTQLLGIVSYAVVCLPAALGIFLAIRALVGLRVHEQEELRGLDLGEHGQEAYGGFQIFVTQ